jgi:hypothetical protein
MTALRSRVLLLLALVVLAASCGDDADGGDGGASSTTTGDIAVTTTTAGAADGSDCLVGEWEADLDSYIEGFGGYLERVGGPALGDISGALTLTMDGERFIANFQDWTVVLVLPGGAGQTTVITDGEQAGDYSGAEDVLTVTDIDSSLTASGSMVIGGVETDLSDGPIDLDSFAQTNLFTDALPYTCDGDRLVLDVVVPDLGEQFTTGLDRVG